MPRSHQRKPFGKRSHVQQALAPAAGHDGKLNFLKMLRHNNDIEDHIAAGRRVMSPRSTYVMECAARGIQPDPNNIVRPLNRPALSLAGASLGDEQVCP